MLQKNPENSGWGFALYIFLHGRTLQQEINVNAVTFFPTIFMKNYGENIYMRKHQRNYSIVSNAYDIHASLLILVSLLFLHSFYQWTCSLL